METLAIFCIIIFNGRKRWWYRIILLLKNGISVNDDTTSSFWIYNFLYYCKSWNRNWCLSYKSWHRKTWNKSPINVFLRSYDFSLVFVKYFTSFLFLQHNFYLFYQYTKCPNMLFLWFKSIRLCKFRCVYSSSGGSHVRNSLVQFVDDFYFSCARVLRGRYKKKLKISQVNLMKKWKWIMMFTPYRVTTHYKVRNMYSKWMIYYKVNLI